MTVTDTVPVDAADGTLTADVTAVSVTTANAVDTGAVIVVAVTAAAVATVMMVMMCHCPVIRPLLLAVLVCCC